MKREVDLHCTLRGKPYWTTLSQCIQTRCPYMTMCGEFLRMKRVTNPPEDSRIIVGADDVHDKAIEHAINEQAITEHGKAIENGAAEAERVRKRKVAQNVVVPMSKKKKKKQKKQQKKKAPTKPARPVHKGEGRGKGDVGGRG